MNFFKFAKDSNKGTLDEKEEAPEFTKADADTFFYGRYSTPFDIDTETLFGSKQLQLQLFHMMTVP